MCTGQAPKQKCKATQIDATNGPRNAWLVTHAWPAAHVRGCVAGDACVAGHARNGVNELELVMTKKNRRKGQLTSQLALKINAIIYDNNN